MKNKISKNKIGSIITTITTSAVYIYLISNMIRVIFYFHDLYLKNYCTIDKYHCICTVLVISILLFMIAFIFGIYIMWFKKNK